MIAAARLPLRSEPANNQFLRPNAHGRIWFSAQLLSMGSWTQELAFRRVATQWKTGFGDHELDPVCAIEWT